MKSKFKFFRGYIGTLDLMDGQTYATASIYNPNTYWTSEEIERERAARMERARYFESPTYGTHMEMIRQDRRIRREQELRSRERMVEHSRQTDEQIRLFQATTTVTVNPTLWTKVKIFGTRVKMVLIETWKFEPIGVVVVSMLITLLTIIGIAKILSIW
jgi:hypothetical protein